MRKVLNALASMIMIIAIILVVGLVGVRLFGIETYTMISGSMEPTYHVGSVVYVKKLPADELNAGDPVTFMAGEDTVVTHRITEIVKDEDGALLFTTKGDANETEDAKPLHEKNVIGKPVFSLPYLGYAVNYIQHPPGMYIAIGVAVMLLIIVFLPDSKKKGSNKENNKN